MTTFINPFTDFGFKKLFGEEASKEMLLSFLNELLANETGIITELTYLNTEQLPGSASKRKSFFDIYCKSEAGDYFIVELQQAKHEYFMERLVYYSTYPIQSQAVKGEWDFQINAVYVIAILDFEIPIEPSFTKSLLTYVQLMNRDTYEVIYTKLTYVFISMKQFNKTENELVTFFDKWLYLLRNMNSFEKYPDKIKDKILMKFLNQAELAQLDDRERSIYERSLKIYRDELLVERSREREKQLFQKGREELEAAKQELEVAKNEVELAKHEVELAKHEALDAQLKAEIAMREAKEKEKQIQQIVHNARNQGMSIEAIAQLLGLSQEEVIQLM